MFGVGVWYYCCIMRLSSVARKVATGLASHWPCVTDFVVYPPLGSKVYEREMSTPVCSPVWIADHLYHFIL